VEKMLVLQQFSLGSIERIIDVWVEGVNNLNILKK
jgi:hypothetical protein